MTLLCAFEDFLGTVHAVPGIMARLHYLASLRDGKREYHHWGLEKTHGPREAQRAIGDTHQLIFVQLLRTPLRKVMEQLDVVERGVLARQQEVKELLPNDLGGGSERHFIAVMKSVSALARYHSASAH